MIIVTGSVLANTDNLEEILALSLEHVRRSRTESGCLAHAVHRDAENPLRLVFVEQWTDRAALVAHFTHPESRAFAKAVRALAVEPPTLNIYEAESVQL